MRFADTAYFLALLNPRDDWHGEALGLSQSRKGGVVTTIWVLTELGDAMSRGTNRELFDAFIARLVRSNQAEIIPATNDWFFRGLDLFRDRPDKEWSLTDCISFAVMKERGISEALTTDHHFRQAGFQPLMNIRPA